MRVLVSTDTFLPIRGGAEVGIDEIFSRVAINDDVCILTPQLTTTQAQAYSNGQDAGEGRAYEVRRVKLAGSQLRWRLLRSVLRRSGIPYLVAINRAISAYRPDLVNFQFLQPHGITSLWVRYVRRVPVVLSLVGRSDVWANMGWARRLYFRISLLGFDAVTQNSSFYLGDHQIRPPVITIPYGANVARYSPERRMQTLRDELGVDAGRNLLVAVQRLDALKGVEVLLRVQALREAEGKHDILAIIGKGPEMDSLKGLSDSLGLTSTVFLGFVGEEDLPGYYASADAFVTHSRYETFGVMFSQAMASGTPIVAADTSCVSLVVRPTNGVVVPADDIAAFSAAIDQVLDPMTHMEIAKSSRTRAVAELDWDVIAMQYAQLFRNLAGVSTNSE